MFKLFSKNNGSAFERVAEHDSELAQAKGKIVSINAAAKQHEEILSTLEEEADLAHSRLSQVKERISKLNDRL